MSVDRIALVAAGAAVALWAVKAAAIGTAGGLDQSPAEGPLFLAGLLALLVAGVALGALWTRRSPRALRSAAGGGGALAVLALVIVTSILTELLAPSDPHWVWAEVNLWVTALLVLGIAWWSRRGAPAD